MSKFIDLDLELENKNPITGDINAIKDFSAINRSIKNLLFTKIGTIPWARGKGTGLWKLIGELNTPLLWMQLKIEITNAIISQEPRVTLDDVRVGMGTNNNECAIEIDYTMRGSSTRNTLEIDLALNR